MKIIKGDATCPQGSGIKCIPHICNDLGKWGKGFVLAVSNRWPETREKYLAWHKSKDKFGLGSVQLIQVEPYIYVANMIAQRGIKTGSKGPPIRYDALEKCLEQLAKKAQPDWSWHLPRIGCGLAGGSWDKVEPILLRTLGKWEITVYDQ
jgi:O-acetyl-ADP-ribose deacetylase (regulator of RNase III)